MDKNKRTVTLCEINKYKCNGKTNLIIRKTGKGERKRESLT